MADEQTQTKEHPLLAARPPTTDAITYLTIIEYNLNEDNLPVLHEVLQDTELTANIGWDLVHLLLPFLPASGECLQDIATRGNPREVILKVTEALQLLDFTEPHSDSDEENEPEPSGNTMKVPTIQVGESSLSPAFPPKAVPPLSVLKYEVLLDILATLHRRVKTKYPSRFLSTSLQAVLAAFNRAGHHMDEVTLATVKFVKTLSGTKRPHLPPRGSSTSLLRTLSGVSEADPEAQSEAPTVDEQTLVNRLLQSFLTHIIEDYILSLSSDDDSPGLCWSSRLMEKYEPRRIVPNKETYADKFAKDEDLKSRSTIVGQLVALAQDLGLKTQELVETIMDPEAEKQGVPGAENEPPATAADIPLSKTGSLLLFAARTVKQELYATASDDDSPFIHIFPDHNTLLKNFLGPLGPEHIGLEAEALLDALISLGLIALEKNNVGEPTEDDVFAEYLQKTSLVSAKTPSPSLRYLAHYLTSTILRSHPDDVVRLAFIRDTLEHCPYENLKASAVTWLKGETLEANANSPVPPSPNPDKPPCIFATPVALSTVAPFLFPDLTNHYGSLAIEVTDSWMQFRQELGFYLAALNFYYLLLTAKSLHGPLDIQGLHNNAKLEKFYLIPLKEVSARFKKELELGEAGELGTVVEGEEALGQAKMDIALLEDVIKRVENTTSGLGWASAS